MVYISGHFYILDWILAGHLPPYIVHIGTRYINGIFILDLVKF